MKMREEQGLSAEAVIEIPGRLTSKDHNGAALGTARARKRASSRPMELVPPCSDDEKSRVWENLSR